MNEPLSLSTAVVLVPRRAGLQAGVDKAVEVLGSHPGAGGPSRRPGGAPGS